MQEIHSILTIMLGPPPAPSEAFTWEYYDADGKYNKVEKTPVEFAAELSSKNTVRACGGGDVNEMFSLVNDPRNEFNTLLSVERLGNVVGGRPITYVNVDMTVCLPLSIDFELDTNWTSRLSNKPALQCSRLGYLSSLALMLANSPNHPLALWIPLCLTTPLPSLT